MHRILIVSPAGPLISQLQEEMRERFGLRCRVLDSDALKEIRRGSELGANPFDHVARVDRWRCQPLDDRVMRVASPGQLRVTGPL